MCLRRALNQYGLLQRAQWAGMRLNDFRAHVARQRKQFRINPCVMGRTI